MGTRAVSCSRGIRLDRRLEAPRAHAMDAPARPAPVCAISCVLTLILVLMRIRVRRVDGEEHDARRLRGGVARAVVRNRLSEHQHVARDHHATVILVLLQQSALDGASHGRCVGRLARVLCRVVGNGESLRAEARHGGAVHARRHVQQHGQHLRRALLRVVAIQVCTRVGSQIDSTRRGGSQLRTSPAQAASLAVRSPCLSCHACVLMHTDGWPVRLHVPALGAASRQ